MPSKIVFAIILSLLAYLKVRVSRGYRLEKAIGKFFEIVLSFLGLKNINNSLKIRIKMI